MDKGPIVAILLVLTVLFICVHDFGIFQNSSEQYEKWDMFVIQVKTNVNVLHERLRTFYTDKYEVYDCGVELHEEPGSLPDFLVAGVHKGGSTSLYGYLTKHGHIRPSACKEIHFFSKESLWKKGMTFYRRHFFDLSEMPHILTGEGTPNYIRNPYAVQRIFEHMPEVKIIVSLRDPTERFISQYVGFVERKLTKKTCDDYWKQEIGEIKTCIENYDPKKHKRLPTSRGKTDYEAFQLALNRTVHLNDLNLQTKDLNPTCSKTDRRCIKRYCLGVLHENAVARSIYSDQLVRWLRYFDADQFHLVQSETLFKDTVGVMQGVARFLGLRNYTQEEQQAFKSTHVGSKHHLNPLGKLCDRERIRSYFARENKLLNHLIEAQWPQYYESWIDWDDKNSNQNQN